MDDLEQAVRIALEPYSNVGRFELCPYCGVTKHSLQDHECRTGPLELPGVEPRDGRARARSYVIE